MGKHRGTMHTREHIAQAFNEAQRHITFHVLGGTLVMCCDLCEPVHYFPKVAHEWADTDPRPTLGDLIDRAGLHFAQTHRKGNNHEQHPGPDSG